jgi:hypothetical protein
MVVAAAGVVAVVEAAAAAGVAVVVAAATNTVTEAPKLCAQTKASLLSMPANKDKIPTWYKPPKLD